MSAVYKGEKKPTNHRRYQRRWLQNVFDSDARDGQRHFIDERPRVKNFPP